MGMGMRRKSGFFLFSAGQGWAGQGFVWWEGGLSGRDGGDSGLTELCSVSFQLSVHEVVHLAVVGLPFPSYM